MKKDKSLRIALGPVTREQVHGMTSVIVGGTGGIGRALARELASLGSKVVVVGQTFRDSDIPNIEFIKADLSLMAEARRAAISIPAEELGLLIFTTGIFAAPQRQQTAEGIERDLAVSYLNRLVMMNILAPRLGRKPEAGAAKPRVFVMGYPGSGQAGSHEDLNAERSYKAMAVHMNTVAGNEILVLDGAKRWPHIAIHGLNPGLIKTNIRDNLLGQGSIKSRLVEGLIGLLAPTPQAYAQRIVPLLLTPQIEGLSGVLFDRKGNAILPSPGISAGHMGGFISAAEALVARHSPPMSPVSAGDTHTA